MTVLTMTVLNSLAYKLYIHTNMFVVSILKKYFVLHTIHIYIYIIC